MDACAGELVSDLVQVMYAGQAIQPGHHQRIAFPHKVEEAWSWGRLSVVPLALSA